MSFVSKGESRKASVSLGQAFTVAVTSSRREQDHEMNILTPTEKAFLDIFLHRT
jgi:hypothetical protein